MQDASSSQQAADLIYDHWRRGAVLDALPEALTPRTRADGYAIQARLEARSKKPLFGWKIAATSRDGQRHIGVDGPLAGRILAEQVWPAGSEQPFGVNRMAVAEPEFAFRFGRDLAPREEAYTQEEVLRAVDSLHTALEIPDSRFADFARMGGPNLIADNACAHCFVLGDACPPVWRELDLAAHKVRGMVADKVTREGRGSNVLGDPRIALTWIANELSGLGIPLKAGQIVTTGTCLVPLPIAPGDAVEADYGTLGRISLRFAA